MLGFDVELVDAELARIVFAHCVAQARSCDEGGMLLTA